MDSTLLLILAFAALATLALMLIYLYLSGSNAGSRGQMRNIVSSQRTSDSPTRGAPRQNTILKSAEEARVNRKSSSRLTLRKKLKFARWSIPPMAFRLCEVGISLVVFVIITQSFNIVIQVISLSSGPIFMRWLLNLFMERRFKAFDADYPQMLMSLVGLLKTGMNPINALEAASQGLDESSLVRQEIELMITRLRYGVSEDKSIGAFGEDVYHPEIELFVQALLLSRRVGGNLSDTLDRLAKQVRKRQYFRNSANAAVGMQRGSIWFIIMIMAAMEVYLYFAYPEAVIDAIKDPFGWQVWQTGLLVIGLGIFWVRQVTKIKV